ncbi:MAG: DUF1566 domain-containing protein [Treponema sp.]|nr:DUF1566 domain-containing protein [Treponema sp.]
MKKAIFLLAAAIGFVLLCPAGLNSQEEKVYVIGDTGPAGGIIFYDKGKVTDGWRYLEAAPKSTEVEARWSAVLITVYQTGEGIGAGRRNTRLIVNELEAYNSEHGQKETNSAAQVCNDLEFGGYSDWFLPSSDELNLIYRNLRDEGLGGFVGEMYWSSTEASGLNATLQRFSDGRRYSLGKDNRLRVRAIRAF